MIYWIVFGIFIAIASCNPIEKENSVIVNEFLDQTLSKINNDPNIDSKINISKIHVKKYRFKNGVLSNLKSWKRSGDALMWSNSREVSISAHVVLQEMVFTADELLIESEKATSPVLKIKDNLLYFLFQVQIDSKSGCKITDHILSWKQLNGTIFSNNPKYNNKNFSLTHAELKHLNKSHNNRQVLKFLLENMIICPHIPKHSFLLQFAEPKVLMIP
uniref:Putative secreted protein n=1 Tax=Panstrongylus lignarius TaxID=156445 RepID=A0A224XSJ2_9HEMI